MLEDEDIRIIYAHPREVIELHLHGLPDRIVHTINYTKRYRGLSINTLNSNITQNELKNACKIQHQRGSALHIQFTMINTKTLLPRVISWDLSLHPGRWPTP